MKRPTITDIARRAGLSKGAVSYALNGQPGVSEETRQRIRAIATELGWHPNSAARALSAARADAVGLVLNRPASTLGAESFYMQLIAGIESVLAERSLALLVQLVADVDAEVAALVHWSAGCRVDGVLLTDLRENDPRVPAMEASRVPAVVVGGPVRHGQLPAVWSDDTAPVRDVVHHLAAGGHRRIARVSGMATLVHTRRRTAAFEQVTSECGLPPPLTWETDYSDGQGAIATRHLLELRPRPTAIVYDNDVMAIAGLGVAHELGLAVPGDISLVAWDDSVLCRLVRPALTAVSRDIRAAGAAATNLLVDLLDGHPGTNRQIATPQLICRASTGPRVP